MELYKVIFLIASLISLGLSIRLYLQYRKFKENSIFVKGQIINIITKKLDSFGEKDKFYFAVVLFKDMKGNEHKVELEEGEGNSKKNNIGDTIDLVYDIRNPKKVVSKNNFNLLFPVILFSMFVIFLLIGLL